MNATPEVRSLQGVELRAAPEGSKSPGVLVGYSAVFESPSEDLGGFVERIRPGAFARSLRNGADVLALVDHEPSRLLGRLSAGTLRTREDARGLRVEVDLPDTSVGRDTAVSIARGDLRGMSFSFVTRSDRWDLSGAPAQRELLDVDLLDVGPVASPAYRETSVALRSLDAARAAATPPPAPDPAPGPPARPPTPVLRNALARLRRAEAF
jgi:uncharacterized protein